MGSHDRIERDIADRRIGICLQRAAPLQAMLRVAPALIVIGQVGFHAIPECDDLQGALCRLLGFSLCLSGLDRVDALSNLRARQIALGAGLLKGDLLRRAEAEPMSLALEGVAINPGLRPSAGDLQVEAFAVEMDACLVKPFDLECR